MSRLSKETSHVHRITLPIDDLLYKDKIANMGVNCKKLIKVFRQWLQVSAVTLRAPHAPLQGGSKLKRQQGDGRGQKM